MAAQLIISPLKFTVSETHLKRQTCNFVWIRFEGYEHLEQLAGTLKKYVSEDKIKRVAFYHH